VTAERELEMQKDAFLAAAAHDLKNPLAAIKGVAQLLSRQAARGQSDKIEPGLAQIDAVATHMTRLINELIDVSRLEMGSEIDLNFAQGNLPALIRQVVEEHQRSTDRHRLRVEADDPRTTGYWDMDRLERVFANLISNAIKYSPQGGDVVIAITRDDGPSGPEAVVTVKDTGLGIPADDLPRIFERFFRGRNTERIISGTGIGLSGVKHIVERHGGSITAESCEGDGSRFTVRLPLAPQTAQPSREVAPHG
jgi:signal transduction histidine kinase